MCWHSGTWTKWLPTDIFELMFLIQGQQKVSIGLGAARVTSHFTWDNVDQDLRHLMATLGYNILKHSVEFENPKGSYTLYCKTLKKLSSPFGITVLINIFFSRAMPLKSFLLFQIDVEVYGVGMRWLITHWCSYVSKGFWNCTCLTHVPIGKMLQYISTLATGWNR